MNLFVSLLPILFQVFFGLEDVSRSNISSKLPVTAPMMACDRRSDSLELVKFYNATGGPNWWKKWDLTKPMDIWFGIKLNSDGCVSSIYLGDTLHVSGYSGNNLIGAFAPLNLPNLKDLYLLNNKLTGNLSYFENLSSLEFLNIFGNQFTGFIPNFNLLNLKHLNISKNNLTGSIPNFNKLPMLEYLEIAYTPITGSIPDFDLPSLKQLTLQYNQLTGSIPNFTGVPNLESIEAYNNQLTGALPNFNKIPNFIALNLGNNKISGTIPNFDNLSNLQSLYLSSNLLENRIPDFNYLPNLKALGLNNNLLSSSLSSFKASSQLENLEVQNNKLDGILPDISHLNRLSVLNLSSNKFTGPIPKLNTFPNLAEIWLANNNLVGFLEDYSSYNPLLRYGTFESNKLTFSDIIKHHDKIKTLIEVKNQWPLSRFSYSPQQKMYSDTTITIPPNTNFILDLLIDDTVTTSTYTWFKDGVPYRTITGSNKLPFIPFTSNDAGIYTVKITNPFALQLTLESWPIRLVASPSLVCDRRSDSLELVRFYNATGGPNWTTKWDLNKSINNWWGIILTEGGCVKEIDLNHSTPGCWCGNNLVGFIPDLNLSELISLGLSGNKLTGSIPDFNKLPMLEALGLAKNQLSGSIPNFSNLKKLKALYLDGNQLSGSIPNFDMPNLGELILFKNKLSGLIPNFDKMPKLFYLFLFENQLSGNIPSFNNLPLLTALFLNNNQLSGTIQAWDNLTKIRDLRLYSNQLNGQIPNFNKMTELEYLYIYQNQLTGSIPDFNLPKLKLLSLAQNRLSGSIPAFNSLKLLEIMRLDNNQLSGSIPNFNMPNIKELELHNNQLIGKIPNFNAPKKLYLLSVLNNKLSGEVQDFTNIFPALSLFYLENNKYTFSSLVKSTTPNKALINAPFKTTNPGDSLRYSPQQKIYTDTTITVPANSNYSLDLKIDDTVTTSIYTWYKNGVLYRIIKGSNKLPFTPFTSNDAGTYTVKITNPLAPQLTLESWPIRLKAAPQLICDRRSDSLELVKFYNATGGSNWINKWDLTKPINSWYGITINSEGCVICIDMDGNHNCKADFENTVVSNNLSGQLIQLNLEKLQILSLPNNKITGPIPDFNNLNNLISLILDRNQFSENIPNFSNLSNLQLLALSYNQLSGNIPNFSNLPSLDRLFLYSNKLNGLVPNFDKLSNLERLGLSYNQLSGNIPNFDKLPFLLWLFLSGNQLVGNIPNFDKLPNLVDIDLSYNQLVGNIPNFNKLPNLRGLSLNLNQLSGEIPNFDNLPNLYDLELFNNKLSGTIPSFEKLIKLEYLWLFNNQLIGSLPSFTELKELKTIRVEYNSISGYISDLGINNKELSQFYLNGNKFTFSNIIRNLSSINSRILQNKKHLSDSISYSPQQKIYSDTSIIIPPCSDYTLDLKIDDTVTTSTYAWSKNGSPFMTIKGSNKLTFKNFTSANNGTYTVSITNPLAPQLTLESHPIRLTSSGAMANINNPRDTSLLCGLSLTLRPITGQNLTNPAYFTLPNRSGTQFNAGQVITATTTLYLHSGTSNCADEDTLRIQFVSPTIILIPDVVKVKHKMSINFDVLINEQIPAGLSLLIAIDQPQNGKIIYSQSTGRGTYTPNDNFSGKEVLNYTVCINGCPNACKSSTITFEVEGPCGDRNSLVLPNIIFPTGSGANRYFIVEAITKCPDSWGLKPHKLQVFNRWGDLVYRNDNYLNNWDGTNTAGQPLPEGTYYYLLDLGSVAAPIKGYVAIVR